MAGVPRLLVTNRVVVPATVLSVSSEQTSAPRAWLKDQLRSKTWRSKIGYNPHALLSDQLPFLDNGVARLAQLTVGNYATPALYAAHVTTQMNAVAVTNTYLCSYDSGTLKFTIARATGAGTFGLPFATGATTRSTHPDLGFASTDLTGGTTYTAGSVSYKSREFVTADFGSALTVLAGIVINHNLGASGTITQQGHTVDSAAGWAAPDVSDVLAGDATIRIVFRASASKRYWRLLINDVSTNALGYSEVGIWFAGPYTQPSISYGIGFEKHWEELSQIAVAMGGAHFQDERPRRPVWALSWLEAPEADRASLAAAFALVPAGKCFFISSTRSTRRRTRSTSSPPRASLSSSSRASTSRFPSPSPAPSGKPCPFQPPRPSPQTSATGPSGSATPSVR